MSHSLMCVKSSWYFQPLYLCAAEEGKCTLSTANAEAELGRWIFSDIEMLREQSLNAMLSDQTVCGVTSILLDSISTFNNTLFKTLNRLSVCF